MSKFISHLLTVVLIDFLALHLEAFELLLVASEIVDSLPYKCLELL